MVRSIVEVETLDHFYWIGGKVNRYHKSDLGHVYFELVNGTHRLSCMLPERNSSNIDFDIKNDMEVEVYGDLHVYDVQVQVQLIVQKVELVDANGLALESAVDILKSEGLYPKPPKATPTHINRIGIITSYGSRAIGDFENTYQLLGQNDVLAPVIWEYVKLEGDQAKQSILDGIEKLSLNDDISVIAIIRGGGRYENLAIFDDLDIARKIATSPKYIVTGIGHYKDSTLADEVSDYVASTPTAVAHFLGNLVIASKPQHTQQSQNTTMNILVGIVAILFMLIVFLVILNFR
jgi:exodeoxyribonuclease VII large subunit